jgi:hypothetical protein
MFPHKGAKWRTRRLPTTPRAYPGAFFARFCCFFGRSSTSSAPSQHIAHNTICSGPGTRKTMRAELFFSFCWAFSFSRFCSTAPYAQTPLPWPLSASPSRSQSPYLIRLTASGFPTITLIIFATSIATWMSSYLPPSGPKSRASRARRAAVIGYAFLPVAG